MTLTELGAMIEAYRFKNRRQPDRIVMSRAAMAEYVDSTLACARVECPPPPWLRGQPSELLESVFHSFGAIPVVEGDVPEGIRLEP